MTGRCINGAERDGGKLWHAVNEDDYPSWKTALCGAKPGERGNGWSSYPGEKITCPRCNKRLGELEAQLGLTS